MWWSQAAVCEVNFALETSLVFQFVINVGVGWKFVEISTHLGGKHMMFTFICLSLLIFVCNIFKQVFVSCSLWLFPRWNIFCGCFQDERYVVFGWLVNLHCVQSSDLQTGASRPLLAPSSLHQIIAWDCRRNHLPALFILHCWGTSPFYIV